MVLVFVSIGLLFLLRPISLGDVTSQSRLLLWHNSWQAWQVNLLLGSGPENFEAAMGKYLSPRLAQLEAYATDRAHNFIFDYGVTTGWLGLLAYLVMIGAALRALWRRRADDFIFSAVFFSLLTAYLVQNFFIFDSFVSYLMLFFALAMMGQNPSSPRLRESEAGQPPFIKGGAENNSPLFKGPLRRVEDEARRRGGIYFPLYKKIILLFAIGYALFAIYAFNLKPLLAAYRANQILSLPASEAAQAGPLLASALALNTFASPEVAYQAALDYIDKINQSPALAQNEEFYNVAATELEKSIGRSPGQARKYLALAWLDLYFSGQASNRIGEAVGLGTRAKELSPNKKDAYLVLVAAYALSGQGDRARETVGQAEAIDAKMGETVKKYWESLK